MWVCRRADKKFNTSFTVMMLNEGLVLRDLLRCVTKRWVIEGKKIKPVCTVFPILLQCKHCVNYSLFMEYTALNCAPLRAAFRKRLHHIDATMPSHFERGRIHSLSHVVVGRPVRVTVPDFHTSSLMFTRPHFSELRHPDRKSVTPLVYHQWN